MLLNVIIKYLWYISILSVNESRYYSGFAFVIKSAYVYKAIYIYTLPHTHTYIMDYQNNSVMWVTLTIMKKCMNIIKTSCCHLTYNSTGRAVSSSRADTPEMVLMLPYSQFARVAFSVEFMLSTVILQFPVCMEQWSEVSYLGKAGMCRFAYTHALRPAVQAIKVELTCVQKNTTYIALHNEL